MIISRRSSYCPNFATAPFLIAPAQTGDGLQMVPTLDKIRGRPPGVDDPGRDYGICFGTISASL
ncbi:hypothetical protein [Corynebacterium glutamicum]|uniref:hypothetical protein n=1 Tax=Corynebacterium glutamicum TaxID=1718 RepID=UPI0002ED0DA9|nr:hypothetical protein [Corynebacterium glutamicum]NII88406.1 hypothetical protein [Corynebacterium glutamicum]